MEINMLIYNLLRNITVGNFNNKIESKMKKETMTYTPSTKFQ